MLQDTWWGVLSLLTPSLFEDFSLDEGTHDEYSYDESCDGGEQLGFTERVTEDVEGATWGNAREE